MTGGLTARVPGMNTNREVNAALLVCHGKIWIRFDFYEFEQGLSALGGIFGGVGPAWGLGVAGGGVCD
jgi:hypothetical protein